MLALLLEQAVVQQQQQQSGDAAMEDADAAQAAGGEVEPAWAVGVAGDLMGQVGIARGWAVHFCMLCMPLVLHAFGACAVKLALLHVHCAARAPRTPRSADDDNHCTSV